MLNSSCHTNYAADLREAKTNSGLLRFSPWTFPSSRLWDVHSIDWRHHKILHRTWNHKDRGDCHACPSCWALGMHIAVVVLDVWHSCCCLNSHLTVTLPSPSPTKRPDENKFRNESNAEEAESTGAMRKLRHRQKPKGVICWMFTHVYDYEYSFVNIYIYE